MNAEVFFDTNILVYLLAGDPVKTPKAEAVLLRGGVISVQVLNELASVASKKLKMPWPEIGEAIAAVRVYCSKPQPITFATHESALSLSGRYGFGFYDSLIVASALNAGCRQLLTEDLRPGQVIDGRLTLVNPFTVA